VSNVLRAIMPTPQNRLRCISNITSRMTMMRRFVGNFSSFHDRRVDNGEYLYKLDYE